MLFFNQPWIGVAERAPLSSTELAEGDEFFETIEEMESCALLQEAARDGPYAHMGQQHVQQLAHCQTAAAQQHLQQIARQRHLHQLMMDDRHAAFVNDEEPDEADEALLEFLRASGQVDA